MKNAFLRLGQNSDLYYANKSMTKLIKQTKGHECKRNLSTSRSNEFYYDLFSIPKFNFLSQKNLNRGFPLKSTPYVCGCRQTNITYANRVLS